MIRRSDNGLPWMRPLIAVGSLVAFLISGIVLSVLFRRKRVDIRKFAGTITLTEDPIEIQRQMRAEWDERDQMIADALKHLRKE